MPTYDHPKLGEVRPSQLIFTYGVGALIDLPHLSVIVTGLDDWPVDAGLAPIITEERLLRIVQSQLGSQVQSLRAPPTVPPSAGVPTPFGPLARVGVPVAFFPRWMYCPRCQYLGPLSSGLFERRDDAFHPDRTRYVHRTCQAANQPAVVPARFLVACPNGHLDDFPWITFAHGGPTTCNAVLRLIEFGPSGEARDLEVRCDTCDKRRRLAEAFGPEGAARLPACRGRRPHLRDDDPTPCHETLTTILVGASNLWFADVVTVLAIPSQSARLAQLVEDHWGTLTHIESEQNIGLLRMVGHLSAFIGSTDHEIWQAIQEKRNRDQQDTTSSVTDVKQPEWAIFSAPDQHPASSDFRLREVAVPEGFTSVLARVVLVERLRDVRALIGFTRIDAPGEFGDTPDAAHPRRVPLSRQPPTWVPAAEVRGEGIFIQFAETAVQAWLDEAATRRRGEQFSEAHQRWRRARGITPDDANDPGMRYVLVHTMAHALMRQFVLECGYTAASIRERLYARDRAASDSHPDPMAGILIYTAAPDSDGTLGGLVSLGEPEHLQRHLRAALRDAALCASDPLCAEHAPSQDGITLHGAACHACLFAPETSCERGNKYLDRSVLVPTVERADLAFFRDISDD